MPAHKDPEWVDIYETPSQSDADLVRTTLEVAGYRVWVKAGSAPGVVIPGYDTSSELTVSVPAEDADDARDYSGTRPVSCPTLTPQHPMRPHQQWRASRTSPSRFSSSAASTRSQPAKYCGIATLDLGEVDLDSRMVALLRSAGLGVNSATFSEYEPGERICTECAGHVVSCEVCGRTFDSFLDQGQYQRAREDEAYVCSVCRGRLEDQLQPDRDW